MMSKTTSIRRLRGRARDCHWHQQIATAQGQVETTRIDEAGALKVLRSEVRDEQAGRFGIINESHETTRNKKRHEDDFLFRVVSCISWFPFFLFFHLGTDSDGHAEPCDQLRCVETSDFQKHLGRVFLDDGKRGLPSVHIERMYGAVRKINVEACYLLRVNDDH